MDGAELEEVFAGLGPVTARAMFGGRGVYHQGRIVAVVFEGELLLKADAVSAPEFEAAGARRWTYQGQDRPVLMPYWSVPDDAYDDPELMTRWTRLAFAAALRAGTAKPSARRRRRGT